jgi:hypothetical protein
MQIPVAIYAFCWILDGLGFIDFSWESLFASADPSFMAAVFLIGIRAILVILAFIFCLWGLVLWSIGVQQREAFAAHQRTSSSTRKQRPLPQQGKQETNAAKDLANGPHP